MRPKFVILNLIILSLAGAAWRSGFFDAVKTFDWQELAMLAAVAVYASIGFGAIVFGRFETARHVANGTPMWALGCTGLGMILAVSDLHSLTPEAMATVFRELAFAIAPNIAGVLLMAWLREALWWCGDVEA